METVEIPRDSQITTFWLFVEDHDAICKLRNVRRMTIAPYRAGCEVSMRGPTEVEKSI